MGKDWNGRRPGRAWLAGIVVLVMSAAGCVASPAVPPPGTLDAVALPAHPFSVVPTRDGAWLFVSLSNGTDHDGGSIALLRRQGSIFVLERSVPFRGRPAGLAMSHDGRHLAMATDDATLLFDTGRLVSSRGDPLLARFGGQSGAIYVAFSPDDRMLAVSEEKAGAVRLIDLSWPDGPRTEITVGRAPVGLAFGPDGHWLYVTSEVGDAGGGASCPAPSGEGGVAPGVVSTIGLPGDRAPFLAATVEAGCGPVRVVLSKDGAVAFVSLRGDNEVAAFLTGDLRLGRSRQLASAPVGRSPVGLALSGDGRTLFVANSNRFERNAAGSVSCLSVSADGTGLTSAGTIASGSFPREIALLPDGSGMAMTLFGSRALQFLPSSCRGS